MSNNEVEDVLQFKKSLEKFYKLFKQDFLDKTGYTDVEFSIDYRGLVAIVPEKNFEPHELAGLSSHRYLDYIVNHVNGNVMFFLV